MFISDPNLSERPWNNAHMSCKPMYTSSYLSRFNTIPALSHPTRASHLSDTNHKNGTAVVSLQSPFQDQDSMGQRPARKSLILFTLKCPESGCSRGVFETTQGRRNCPYIPTQRAASAGTRGRDLSHGSLACLSGVGEILHGESDST